MVEISGDVNCPHCKKDHPATIDLDKLEVKQPKSPKVNNPEAEQQTILENPQLKEVEKIVEKVIIPSDQPFYECKDCHGLHENKNYKVKPSKKCNNCGSLNGPKNKGCKNCANKEFEDMSDEELEELGIPNPKIEEHEHEPSE